MSDDEKKALKLVRFLEELVKNEPTKEHLEVFRIAVKQATNICEAPVSAQLPLSFPYTELDDFEKMYVSSRHFVEDHLH